MNLTPRQTVLDQVIQKLAPVHVGFRQCHRYTQHALVTAGNDAHGDQYGAVHHLDSFAYALIACIQ